MPHTVRPLLNWGLLYSKFSEQSIEEVRRAMLIDAAAALKTRDYGKDKHVKEDFVERRHLDALDEIEYDEDGSYGSGKALPIEGGEADFGPSSETKIDTWDDGEQDSRRSETEETANVFDNGEIDDVLGADELAFVGLYQPDRGTPAPRPGRGAMDGYYNTAYSDTASNRSSPRQHRNKHKKSNNRSATPQSQQDHLDVFDNNDFEDVASYGSLRSSQSSGRSSVSPSEDLSIDLSPSEIAEKRRKEEAALFMYGHHAGKGRVGEDEPAPAKKAKHPPKGKVEKKPKEAGRAPRAPSDDGSLKQIWQQSNLRTSATASRSYDDWIPSKHAVAASTGDRSTASPVSQHSPTARAKRATDIFDDYYGVEDHNDFDDMSSGDGDTIDTVATAGNSLDEQEKGLPVPISTLQHPITLLLFAMFVCFISADYKMSVDLNKDQLCDTFQNAFGISLIIDFAFLQPVFICMTYLFRYLDSDDGDDMFSELHPYEGEIREYWGLGDPTEGLKRMTTVDFEKDGNTKWF